MSQTHVAPLQTSDAKMGNFLGTAPWPQGQLNDYVRALLEGKASEPSGDAQSCPPLRELLSGLLSQTGTLSQQASITPEELEGIYTLGYQAFEQQDYQQAARLFRLLVILNPLETRFLFCLGRALEEQKNPFAALTAYMMQSQLDLQDPVGYFHAAVCLLELQQIPDAMGYFQKAVERCDKASLQHQQIAQQARVFLKQHPAPAKG